MEPTRIGYLFVFIIIDSLTGRAHDKGVIYEVVAPILMRYMYAGSLGLQVAHPTQKFIYLQDNHKQVLGSEHRSKRRSNATDL